MIANFKDTHIRSSGVIYQSALQQIKMLYDKNPQLAGELAISIIELTLTGEISTDDTIILLALENLRSVVQNNQERYDKTKEAKRIAKIQEYKLDTIADLYLQGKSQIEIAKILGVNKQTINYRLNNMIKTHYPELLLHESNKKFDQGNDQSKNFLTNEAESQKKFFDTGSNQSKKLDELSKIHLTTGDHQSKKSDENLKTTDATSQKSQISQTDVNVNVNEDFLTSGQIIYKTISAAECRSIMQKEVVDASQGLIKDLSTGIMYKVLE